MTNHRQLLLFLCGLVLAGRVAAQPLETHITFSKDALTAADVRKANLKFFARQVDLYDKHTKDTPKARKAARTFLKHALATKSGSWFNESPLVRAKESLLKLAQAAMEDGSEDPLVRAYYVFSLLENGELRQALEQADAAVATAEKGYPPTIEVMACYARQLALKRKGDTGPFMGYHSQLLKQIPGYFEWATEEPNMQRAAWTEFLKFSDDIVMVPDEFEQMIRDYEASPKKDPWLLEMIKGRYHHELVWCIEGREIYNPREHTQEEFNTHIQLAGNHFREAWKLHPEDPTASSWMMSVSRSGFDDDSPQQWFDRAIEAQMDYMPAYEEMLFTHRPRMGGSHAAMAAFGEACARTGRFDTHVPFMFVRAMLDIADELDGNWDQINDNIPQFYKKMKFVLEKMARHPSRRMPKNHPEGRLTLAQRQYYTHLLAFAIKVREYDDANKCLKLLGDEFDLRLFYSYGMRKDFDRSAIAAGQSLEKYLSKVDNLRLPPHSIEKSRQVYAAYTKIKKRNKNRKADYFLQAIINQAKLEMDYDDGKWVDLTFDPDLVQWKSGKQLFTVENERSVVADNYSSDAWIQLYHRGFFPGPKEFTVEIEQLEKISRHFAFGAHMGYCYPSSHGMIEPDGRIFYVLSQESFVNFGQFSPDRQRELQDRVVVKEFKFKDGSSRKDKMVKLEEIRAGIGRHVIERPNHVIIGPNGKLPMREWSVPDKKVYRLHVKVWDQDHYEFYVNDEKVPIDDPMPGFTMSSNMVGIGTSGYMGDVGKLRFKNVRIRRLTEPPPGL